MTKQVKGIIDDVLESTRDHSEGLELSNEDMIEFVVELVEEFYELAISEQDAREIIALL